MSLRPIDLARVAGVSAQQIRNYEDAGVLPPVSRTPSGHRRYDEAHREALLAYRALAAGYGPRTAQQTMRAIHAGDTAGALAVVDAAHARIHQQRQLLHDTGTALAAVAEHQPDPPHEPVYIRDVARLLGVRTSALRVWEAAGLLTPQRERGTGYRVYAAADLRDARMIQLLRQSNYPLQQIGPVLDGLRRTGSSAELRAAISRRQSLLATVTLAMIGADGRLHAYLSGLGDLAALL